MTKSRVKKPSARQGRRTPFVVGDRVERNKAVGGPVEQRGDMAGTILKITAVALGAGGTRARVRVRWDNGHEDASSAYQRTQTRSVTSWTMTPSWRDYAGPYQRE